MRVDCAPAAQLTAGDWQAWDAIRRETPGLSSPYFAPEFCRAVASCSPDLFVARIRGATRVAGFFPFHRSRWRTGWPLARWLSDYQGVIARDDVAIDPTELLRGCGLKTFDFDHLLASQRSFLPFSHGGAPSHTIDLRAGFDRYVATIGGSSSVVKATWRQGRALARAMGPVRFAYQVDDPAAFGALVRLKSLQYSATGVRDLFADRWTRDVVSAVVGQRSPGLSGVLSVLFVGDRMAALVLSMRSGPVLHYWFPAYDARFARYSPGILLLLELAKAASTSGVDTMDLGTGDHAYKSRLATGTVALFRGRIERPSAVVAWRMARRGVVRLSGWVSSRRSRAA